MNPICCCIPRLASAMALVLLDQRSNRQSGRGHDAHTLAACGSHSAWSRNCGIHHIFLSNGMSLDQQNDHGPGEHRR
jgi:hypothetical protein